MQSAPQSDSHMNQWRLKILSATCVRFVTYFVPWLHGEVEVWEEGVWSEGAIESGDTRQERPEDHQDMNIPAQDYKTALKLI